MQLRDLSFGSVFVASGALNFFGEGYWFHQLFKPLGLDCRAATFVSKTATLEPRDGNMFLRQDSTQPIRLMPDCIVVKPVRGVILNAVGLSNPGISWLLNQGRWQKRASPFLISFMAVGPKKTRADEYRRFSTLIAATRREFVSGFGIELNLSCPNAGLNQVELVGEAHQYLDALSSLDVPLVIKLSALVSPKVAMEIAKHRACDAICCSNTIPYGQLPDRIDWKGLFGSDESPLAKYGGGGLSGKPLLDIVAAWIMTARAQGFPKPIIGGGGILDYGDARKVLNAGADAVSIGSAFILRPWRIRRIIDSANLHKCTPEGRD